MAAPTRIPSGTTILTVGTKRGLFLLTSKTRDTWDVTATSLTNGHIFYAALDQRQGMHRLFAADNGDFFGSFLRYSDDFGETWHDPERGIQFPEGGSDKLKNIWVIEPGRPDEPGVIYAGVDPATLWISEDSGNTWTVNEGLASHPTRDRWEPGAGGLCLHTIVPDYANPARMWLGISAVGCLRTDDGGKTWAFMNKNVRASFLPDKYPEFGQCLHRMVQHPTQPDVLYQQNHCGIYKSLNSGDDWIDIQGTLPSEFGFPIALDAHHPDTVFVVVENPMFRGNFGEQFTIYRTRDGGEHWEPLSEGLPAGAGVRMGVLRHGMTADRHDPCGIYVGTNTGQLFASTNGGDSWRLIADFLPPIYSVGASVVE